jgi:hypothetical protein
MAALSALLAAGLKRRQAGARVTAIGLESFMACFGVYLALSSVAGLFAGGAGALLSWVAVGCLVSRPARLFTQMPLP